MTLASFTTGIFTITEDTLEMLAELIDPPFEARPLPHGVTWRDDEVTHHAGGVVYPGRRIVDIPGRTFASTPETCSHTGPCEWISDDVLICSGCGLDAT